MAEEIEISYGKGHFCLPEFCVPLCRPGKVCTDQSKGSAYDKYHTGIDMAFDFTQKAVVCSLNLRHSLIFGAANLVKLIT